MLPAATGCLLLTIGCVIPHVQRYPAGWAPLEEPARKQCADIAGTYRDLGETGGKEPGTRSLSGLLWRVPVDPLGSVRVEQPDPGTLEVSLWRDELEITRKRYVRSGKKIPRGERFWCKSDGINLIVSYEGDSSEELYLLKTADGSLVAREWTWFTASFFGFVERLWFRFPAMEPAPGTQATKVVNP